jgi:hypothetical protein
MRRAAWLCWRLSSFTVTLSRLYRRPGQTSLTTNKGFVSVLVPWVHGAVP